MDIGASFQHKSDADLASPFVKSWVWNIIGSKLPSNFELNHSKSKFRNLAYVDEEMKHPKVKDFDKWNFVKPFNHETRHLLFHTHLENNQIEFCERES